MKNLLPRIDQAFEHLSKINPSVSEKGVDWHLDHLFRVLIGMSDALAKSNPAEYKFSLNAARTYIFMLGKIPRGKGKAPSQVVTKDEITMESLMHQYKIAQKQWVDLDSLPPKSNFKHPYFGILNLKQSKKSMYLHTKHHLDIIKDIIRK